jgi:hypothetical protein
MNERKQSPGPREEHKYVLAILLGNAAGLSLGLLFLRDELAWLIGFVLMMTLCDVVFLVRPHYSTCSLRLLRGLSRSRGRS